MISKIKEVMRKLKGLDLETLEYIKYTFFVLIVVDLFGIFWYFQLKKLGIAIMLVSIVGLSIILILERRKHNEMDDYKVERKKQLQKELDELNKEEKDEKKPEKEESSGMDFGLPDPDEYNERVAKSLGTF